MFALVCVIGLASIVNVESIKTVRVRGMFEDHMVAQDITDDPQRNTVLIVVGQVKGYDELKSSVNLHDFNMGYVALKDVADGTCLLKPLPENKREHIPGLSPVSGKPGEKFVSWHKTMYWFRHPKVLEYEEVREQAGETLAEFCRDYKTYNLIPRGASRKFLAGQSNGQRIKRCDYLCGFCPNEIDGYEEDVIEFQYSGPEN